MPRLPILSSVPLLTLCLLSACTSSRGLPVEPLQEILREEADRFEAPSPAPPPRSIHTRPEVPALGLYLKRAGILPHDFEWTDRNRDHVLAWARTLATNGDLSGAQYIPRSSLKGFQLSQLRDSSARYGTDLLLVLDGAGAVDRYNNSKGRWLYWTILGTYFADGTHSDALCLVRGSLWDVKSGAFLFEAQAEGRAHTVGPAAFLDDTTAVEQAKARALENLERMIAEELRRLRKLPQTDGPVIENQSSREPKKTGDSATGSGR
ncbi:conserved protein of unknown function [Nitrospira japonica]|uniref:Lipoprotein n=1 Tax=Nitrospira japonica TaxID=1325564 RepID=A0A1W1I225_9BACT|nr:hypothetical protein [Nitrospira japonica]SLM47058.1 conserved protein of unknown function [Nitrospira japonica]